MFNYSDFQKALEYNHKRIDKDNTLFVIDTNYLLGMFKSYENGEKYFKVLEKLKDNTFIPFMIIIEFSNHIENIIKSTRTDIGKSNAVFSNKEKLFNKNELKKAVENTIYGVADGKSGFTNLDTDIIEKTMNNSMEEIIQELEGSLTDFNTKFKDVFSIIKKKHQKSINYNIDDYNEIVNRLLRKIESYFNMLGNNPLTQETIDGFMEMKASRYENRISPGWDEINKHGDVTRTFGHLTYPDDAADLIWWFETIEYLENNDRYKNLVIVTDDGTANNKGAFRDENEIVNRGMKTEAYLKTGIYLDIFTSNDFVNMYADTEDKETLKEDISIINKNREIKHELFGELKFSENQGVFMYDIFKYFYKNELISTEKFLNIGCVTMAHDINKINTNTQLFNNSYELYDEYFGDPILIGTSANIEQKLRYIRDLFKFSKKNPRKLLIHNQNIQGIWSELTNDNPYIEYELFDKIKIKKSQSEMMQDIFQTFLTKKRVNDRILSLDCVSASVEEEKSLFINHREIYVDDIVLYVGTTANINQKLNYIKELFTISSVDMKKLEFYQQDLQEQWIKINN